MNISIARMGEPILKRHAEYVDFIKDKNDLPLWIAKMREALEALNERIGIAAPQVFIGKKLILYRLPKRKNQRYQSDEEDTVDLTILINPVWTPTTDEQKEGYEACISLPGLMGVVPRYKDIHLVYEDLNGQKCAKNVSGFHARVIQHECDHLEGILYPQRMKDLSLLGFEDVVLKKSVVN